MRSTPHPLHEMISTVVPVRPGRTCAGTPSPTQNRRYATASGGPGPTTTKLRPAVYRVREWFGNQVTLCHPEPAGASAR